MNIPMFSNTKEKKKLLKSLLDAYYKSEEPPAQKMPEFEYIERTETDIILVSRSQADNKTFVIMGGGNMKDKEIIIARDKIRKKMEIDELQFFINKYS